MRVCLYMRYSSNKQTEQSIEGQDRVCTEFCNRKGYTIVTKYIDRATSAFHDTEKRFEFQRMIKDSEKHHFDAVVVYRLDRFARKKYDSAIYKNRLKRNGVQVISATENISDSPDGIILESVLEGMAEFYSSELSQKVKRGMTESALKAQSNGGHVPIGYKVVDKKFVIDEPGAAVVKEAFNRYANGETMADIIRSFTERGIKTSKNKYFTSNGIYTMLKNEKYIGVYKFRDVRIEDGVPRIVDDETFNKVKDRMQLNKKMPARAKANVPFLLTGKIFCGKCGSPFNGDSGTSKHKTTYHYYTCSNKKHRKGCNMKSVPKDFIEDIAFKNALNKLTEENINKIADMAVEAANEQSESKVIIESLKAKQKEASAKIENLIKTFESGYISDAVVQRIKELEEEQKSFDIRIREEELNNISISKEQVIFYLKKFAEGDINDMAFKRMVIDLLIHSITVYEDPDGDKDTFKLVTAYNICPNQTYTETYNSRVLLSMDSVYQSNIIRTPKDTWVLIVETIHRKA